jgi:hypothetical protein
LGGLKGIVDAMDKGLAQVNGTKLVARASGEEISDTSIVT